MANLPLLVDPRDTEEYLFEMGLYPFCNAMCEALAIPQIIDEAVGPPDPRAKMSTGALVKAFILNILDQRTPIMHMADSFKYAYCEVLFGNGIIHEDLTEDRLDTALDMVAEINHRKVYSQVALRALNMHGVKVESAHVDTTNVSVHGEYDQPPEDDFKVTYGGDPKNKRKDLKMFILGVAVQQDRLPLIAEGLSGNSSDAVWFRDALGELAQMFKGNLFTRPVFVFDAAASNDEMFTNANDLEAPCIIRLSERFKIATEYTQKAWEENRWQSVGQIASHTNKNTSDYRITPFKVELGKGDWRLIVVHSSALEKSKEVTAARRLPESQEKIRKKAAKLAKQGFATEAEAKTCADEFIKEHIGLKTPFTYQVQVTIQVKEKYAKPGKPAPDTPKVTITTYYPEITIGEVDKKIYNAWLRKESCFILVSNVPSTRYSSERILKEYKGQWRIEDQYRFIKNPLILGSVWLHLPRRIKALTFILSLAMMTASYLCYRVAASLAGEAPTKEFAGSEKQQRQLRVAGRRLVKKPTFKVIRDLLIKVKTICYWDEAENRWIRKFLRRTQLNLLHLIQDLGFHPAIYLEPFRPEFDLWEYAPLKT